MFRKKISKSFVVVACMVCAGCSVKPIEVSISPNPYGYGRHWNYQNDVRYGYGPKIKVGDRIFNGREWITAPEGEIFYTQVTPNGQAYGTVKKSRGFLGLGGVEEYDHLGYLPYARRGFYPPDYPLGYPQLPPGRHYPPLPPPGW